MKKTLLSVLLVAITALFIFISYMFIDFLSTKSVLSGFEKYNFVTDEEIVKAFNYDKHDYVISVYRDGSSWANLNVLLKYKQNYYLLKNIKSCDTVESGSNLYVKDNEIYVHCIGKSGNIDKYKINNLNIESETLFFNYENTPNISQLHISIDNVDNEYVYLSSPFKVDVMVANEPKVKCSLKDKMCKYH